MPYRDSESRNAGRKNGNYNEYMRGYAKKHPLVIKKAILRKFGISIETYQALFDSQGGVCAVCEKPEKVSIKKGMGIRSLAVDHNHKTGKIRGLLCCTCNMALGNLYENEELIVRLLSYLRKHE